MVAVDSKCGREVFLNPCRGLPGLYDPSLNRFTLVGLGGNGGRCSWSFLELWECACDVRDDAASELFSGSSSAVPLIVDSSPLSLGRDAALLPLFARPSPPLLVAEDSSPSWPIDVKDSKVLDTLGRS